MKWGVFTDLNGGISWEKIDLSQMRDDNNY